MGKSKNICWIYSDIKVIKDVVKEQSNSEEKEYQEELNELEKLEEIEKNQKEEI